MLTLLSFQMQNMLNQVADLQRKVRVDLICFIQLHIIFYYIPFLNTNNNYIFYFVDLTHFAGGNTATVQRKLEEEGTDATGFFFF